METTNQNETVEVKSLCSVQESLQDLNSDHNKPPQLKIRRRHGKKNKKAEKKTTKKKKNKKKKHMDNNAVDTTAMQQDEEMKACEDGSNEPALRKLTRKETFELMKRYEADPDNFVLEFTEEQLFRLPFVPKSTKNKLYLTHPIMIFEFRPKDNPDLKSIFDVSTKSNKNLTFRCRKNGHAFDCRVSDRTNKGTGCKRCVPVKRSLLFVCPEAAAELINGDGSDIYAQSHQELDFKCSYCGEKRRQRVSDFVNYGSGCKCCKCSSKSLLHVAPHVAAELINRDGLYIYAQSNQELEFKCGYCGKVRQQRVKSFVNTGSGCKCCKKYNKSLLYVAPEVAAELVDKESAKFINAHSKQKRNFRCSVCNHIWTAKLYNRVANKTGCPACAKSSTESKGETAVENVLKGKSINPEREHRFEEFKKYPFDFYLPNHNCIIEVDGSHHFVPKSFGSDQSSEYKEMELLKRIRNDRLKQDFAVNNKKLHVLRIDYKTNIDDYRKIIMDFLQEISSPTSVPCIHYTNKDMYLETLQNHISPLIKVSFTESSLQNFDEGVSPYDVKIEKLKAEIDDCDYYSDDNEDDNEEVDDDDNIMTAASPTITSSKPITDTASSSKSTTEIAVVATASSSSKSVVPGSNKRKIVHNDDKATATKRFKETTLDMFFFTK